MTHKDCQCLLMSCVCFLHVSVSVLQVYVFYVYICEKKFWIKCVQCGKKRPGYVSAGLVESLVVACPYVLYSLL